MSEWLKPHRKLLSTQFSAQLLALQISFTATDSLRKPSSFNRQRLLFQAIR
jgi:hypothetical protein